MPQFLETRYGEGVKTTARALYGSELDRCDVARLISG